MTSSRDPCPFEDEVGTGNTDKITGVTRARDRLSELGKLRPFFTAAEAMQTFQWDSFTVAQYLWRWKCANRIVGLGGKSDVFFNLLADSHWERHIVSALSYALPHARQMGAHVLQAAGLITQIASHAEFIVTPRETCFKIEVANIKVRPAVWTSMLDKNHGTTPWRHDENAAPSIRLLPGAALLDVLLFEREHGFAPDDIDFEELSEDQARLFLTLARKASKTKMVAPQIAVILSGARIMKDRYDVQKLYETVFDELRKLNGQG